MKIYALIGGVSLLLSGCSPFAMSDENMSISVTEFKSKVEDCIVVGINKVEVENCFNSLGMEFSYLSRERLKTFILDVDKTQMHPNAVGQYIAIKRHIEKEAASTKSFQVKVDIDESDLAVKVATKEIITGP